MNQEQTQALGQAIDREKRAYELYNGLLKKAPNRNLQILFNTLAMEELKHTSLLQECIRGGDLETAKAKIYGRHDEMSLAGKLQPTVDIAGVREALEFAMKKEQAARETYKQMKKQVFPAEVKHVFDFLMQEEEKHEMLIKEELGKL